MLLECNDGREPARTLLEALPDLDTTVPGALADPETEEKELLKEDAAPYLHHHGIAAETTPGAIAACGDVADQLIPELQARGADIMVTGGYSGSRLVGGGTDRLLDDARAPIPMAHWQPRPTDNGVDLTATLPRNPTQPLARRAPDSSLVERHFPVYGSARGRRTARPRACGRTS